MNVYLFIFIPVFLLADSLYSLIWSSLFTTDPLGTSYIKNGTWIRPTIPQANPWTQILDEVRSQLDNIAHDIPDYTTSRTLLAMVIPVNETITFHRANRNLSVVRQENLNPAGIKSPITELFQTMTAEPSKTLEFNRTGWQWLSFNSARRQLIKYGTVLLEILKEAHRSRQGVVDVIRTTHRDSLDGLAHQICYVSEELGKHTRRATNFGWPFHMNLQEAYMETEGVCKQVQAAREDLKALSDRVCIEMQAIGSLMRQVDAVIADLRKNEPLSEKMMDVYEAEYFWIGASAIALAEVGWLEL